jgi:hypothetical protein
MEQMRISAAGYHVALDNRGIGKSAGRAGPTDGADGGRRQALVDHLGIAALTSSASPWAA